MSMRLNQGLFMAAATAVFAMGCGDIMTPTDGGAGCTSDSNCSTGKGCHPVLKECVDSCTGEEDCPASAKTCAAISSSASKFCSCSTDELCNGGTAGSLVCNAATKRCGAKCTSNAACGTGFTCSTTSGNCVADAPADAGTSCTGFGTCAYPEVCNFVSSKCEAGATCSGANTQPDTCGVGGYCTGANNCAQVAVPSCGNFLAGSAPLSFGATSTGPVIIDITKVSFGTDTTFCGNTDSTRVKLKIRAYDTGARLDSETSQPSLKYYRTTGTTVNITGASIQAYTPLASGAEASFDVNLCAPAGISSLVVGFAYDNGNGACFTAN